LVLMIASAFAEVVTLGAVLPFLAALTGPEKLWNWPLVAAVAPVLGIESPREMIFAMAVGFAIAAVSAGAVRVLLSWVTVRVSFGAGTDLSAEVYRRTLYQPYSVHVMRNSSEVISGITHKVTNVVEVLYQALMLASSVVLLVAIIAALIFVNPVIALTAISGFGIAYGLIGKLAQRRLRQNSLHIAEEQTQVIKALQEGLGGIRDVLLDGTQATYWKIYRRADVPLRRAQGNNNFIGAAPRFIMEALGMVLIAALAYGLSLTPGGITDALPSLGALALGAQRLLPVLQQCFVSWASITGRAASVTDTLALLDQPLPAIPESGLAPLILRESVRFQNVRFRYTPTSVWVLDDLNLVIPRGARVGVVGTTGSGKTTALDLLMGLLQPTEGALLVDGEPLTGGRAHAWQRAIAHVPQAIYLSDDTFAANIAFGLEPDQIDLERVRDAARQAQIDEFIRSRPGGYQETVGERGVRLSGGQRQRIGIARALYKKAGVLVFDEATSALDNATEESVMQAIDGLGRHLTVIMIAHRLSTVQRCDFIVELGAGRVVAQGTYQQLLAASASFARMARQGQ
jgi:ABC-type multidrug transport system fused ATPase/permease subunit